MATNPDAGQQAVTAKITALALGRLADPNQRAKALVFTLLLALVAVYSAIVPPLQSPDECSHLKRAYLLTRGVIMLDVHPTHGSGGMIDQGLAAFIAAHLYLPHNEGNTVTRAMQRSANDIAWTKKTVFEPAPGAGYYFPLIYAPHAIGLGLGELFGLSLYHSYLLTRFTLSATCLALIFLALGIYRPNFLVLTLLLLPMSVFQLATVNIDGLTTALTLVAVGLFLRVADRRLEFRPWMSHAMAVAVFILVTCRPHLLPLLALPFVCAMLRRSKRDLLLGLLVTVASLGWIGLSMSITMDLRQSRDLGVSQLLLFYLTHPRVFFSLLWNTLQNDDLLLFYRESFIGVLGWLDAKLADHYYAATSYFLIFTALISLSINNIRQDYPARLLLLFMALASLALIFFALLIAWTPHPSKVITGVQGRYFITPAIIFAYALSGSANVFSLKRSALASPAIAAWFIASAYHLAHTLVLRYYATQG